MTEQSGFDRSALIYKDVKDQPKAKYYLLLELGMGGKGTFAVDAVEETTHSIRGTRRVKDGAYNDYALVIAFSPEIPWTLVSADYLNVITMEEMVRREHADTIRLRNLSQALKTDKTKDEDDEDEDVVIAVPLRRKAEQAADDRPMPGQYV